jgi:crotonobetainyl-CoA:carnitine CoA-transferase CaiB-like acyl-CoA transferase
VEVVQEAVHAVLMDKGGLFEELGMIANVEHPLFGEHVRARALVTFSRSGEDLRPGCLVGQHTSAILQELGYGEDRIADLRARQIVAG